MVVPVKDSGSNAYRKIGFPDAAVGCEIAQIIGLEFPFDEIEVKKPGACTLGDRAGDCATLANAAVGEV